MLACDGKRAYRTFSKALVSANGRLRDGVPYLRVYHCPHCDLYHLTSQRDAEKRRPVTGGKWPERSRSDV